MFVSKSALMFPKLLIFNELVFGGLSWMIMNYFYSNGV